MRIRIRMSDMYIFVLYKMKLKKRTFYCTNVNNNRNISIKKRINTMNDNFRNHTNNDTINNDI